MSHPVFLLSDFGSRDVYVGVMRAVLAGLAPGSAVHDLVHDLPPQDVAGASLQLGAALPYLPDGSILCAVVDPGVGSDRRGVVVRARYGDGRTSTAVAPDNGLLSPLLAPFAVRGSSGRAGAGAPTLVEAWTLDRDRLPAPGPGTTFDGRDLFAPAAGRLAAGAEPSELGTSVRVDGLTLLEPRRPRRDGDGWRGEVRWIDRFGNLVTNLGPDELPDDPGAVRVHVGGTVVSGVAAGFFAAPVGAPVAYLGSLGRLEIGVRDGDAAEALEVRVGDEVRLTASD